ncbi:RNA polymerase sigma factor [Sungkyunkwania multivorans]|uniref:RNA polymerase sigma factor n=1 Tax=Sungkyunkwania multivorans TaxID=1173618 RepID=A0ABW3CVR1_9FLAO
MNKPEKIVDSMLVLSYQSGNDKALALLVRRWHKKLCKQAYWYTKDSHASKDLAQDSWQAIIKNVHKLKDTHQFGSWAMTIVTRKAIDHLKSQKRSNNNFDVQNFSSVEKEMEPTTEGDNDLQKVKVMLKQLPDEKRVILTLFYIEEYSLREIGEILNISVGTVKTRLFRAREKLRTIIKTKHYEK